jgi:hypothetical protein
LLNKASVQQQIPTITLSNSNKGKLLCILPALLVLLRRIAGKEQRPPRLLGQERRET